MTTVLIPTDEIPVALSEGRALVERIAASVELRRAARLRAFLLYVCEQSLNHGVKVIHEQEIGIAVFGRPSNYDTGIDNIVRVNATELRRRLEHYFSEEGGREEVVLEIQRGNYSPTFRRRLPINPGPGTPANAKSANLVRPASNTNSPASEPAQEQAISFEPVQVHLGTAEAIHPATILRWWQIAVALLILICGYLAWQLRVVTMHVEPWRQETSLRRFWGDFFTSGTQTDIILADTSFAIAEDMMQRPISLADYLDYTYKRSIDDPGLTADQRRDLMLVLERNTGSIADFQVGRQILSLDPTDPDRLTLKYAREFAPDAAKHNNVVLIGSRQSNPWVSLFGDKLNFDLTYDIVHGRASIVNRAPRPGESSTYPAAGSADGAGTGYAVIAYLPGVNQGGKTLIIEGTDSQATGAAGDYMTNEESLRTLESKLPSGKTPYFEALLRTSELNGIPLHGEVIALRIHDNR
jgi:hypothetical protein